MDAQFFDGRIGRARAVRLRLAVGRLVATPADAGTAEGPWDWPLSEVLWPERTRHGRRVIELRRGGTLVVDDAAAFDAWRAAEAAPHGVRESWVVHAQQHWRGVMLALLLLTATLAAGWRWGLPAAAAGLVALVPPAAEQRLGDAALETLDKEWFAPTRLPPEAQRVWRERFAAL
ncbi:MAG: peptidase M48, partial [Rubrivivax sp.]